ncbi:type II secretion system protein [Caminibacter pacificus]|uniref:General secretion pathway protein G n=1 Tax=Caminibacter pacificus TaxID=1424653 RepID=A0AAJ4RCK2_9BACT|nr:type II secretion system protein [Caminibacter pacificus]QCI27967.1 type II secretion system protein [Caminibacter pacificus]ROR39849.1 general secretion pathway protein G [Caminibacter pacificus]
MKKAFTMMELIFVIVVIGILAAVALPRLFTGISDAKLAKAKTQIATVRSGISSLYSKNILAGNSDQCPELERSITDVKVFENVVQGGIPENQSDVNWRYDNNSSTETNYTLTIDNQEGNFTYEKNSSLGCPFSCVNGPLCNKLQ